MWEELHLSENTKTMLNALVERKKKWDSFKTKSRWCSWISLLGSTWVVYSYLRISSSSNMAFVFRQLTERRFVWAAVITGGAVMALTHFAKKTKEAKDKYEKLRSETIAHLDTRWTKSDLADRRDQVSRIMKEKHGINVSFMG